MQTMELMRKQEVAADLKIAKRTLELWVTKGIFPKPEHLGVLAYWSRENVEAWKRSRFPKIST